MLRQAAFFAFFSAFSLLRGASPALIVENELLPSPAGVGSSDPALIEAGSTLVLRWINASGRTENASFDPIKHTWTETPLSNASAPETNQVVHRAGRSAKAWFDHTPNDPSIRLSVRLSPTTPFLIPVRIEDGKPCGAPALVLLGDGTVFVSWPEHHNQNETALWLRRISPGGSLSVPVLLAVLPEPPAGQRLGLVKDFDVKPAQLLLAYSVGEGETAQIVTRLLTIAPATNDPRRNPCHTCPDPDEAARGYGLRGLVVSASNEQSTIAIKHGPIGDVLPAGTTEFSIDPAILQSAATGKELFARIEKRGDRWWLFAPSWIVK